MGVLSLPVGPCALLWEDERVLWLIELLFAGVLPNMILNGRHYVVPMSVEEPSVIGPLREQHRLAAKHDSLDCVLCVAYVCVCACV